MKTEQPYRAEDGEALCPVHEGEPEVVGDAECAFCELRYCRAHLHDHSLICEEWYQREVAREEMMRRRDAMEAAGDAKYEEMKERAADEREWARDVKPDWWR